ncbi:MAG: RNA methyltransferase [Paludibacteraceae bacterium]|nr:RNA methyltransferase [Paludibacteraceae bacterium]HOI26823.1 RNA methyltransferase [Paludibacteraceae bacterium]HOU68627.1 RNA methyltransferase [Paludibacteraceae bacterium]HPH63407.1 RNA methyltransferase [Paludibacteraceae bacterium]HQF50447.1 RNA methyltransferase [Paludibacteraceae bacterium]
MLSKNKIKQIQSLSKKKERDEASLFVAEGNKIVSDLLPLFACQTLVATDEFLSEHPGCNAEEVIVATCEEIKKASLLCSPQSAIALFHQPKYVPDWNFISNNLSLMLDTVQDPGNLGTIIRIADWFGIRDILCSNETVDVYNPKVVQATMGAVGRVRVHYGNLCSFIDTLGNKVPVFGTFLNGENIYEKNLPKNGIVVMGNEGNGITPEVEKKITERLFIPSFQTGNSRSESLNVAVATAITCSEFRRRTI